MTEILLFNIEAGKSMKIKNLCRKLYIGAREIPREQFGVKLGAILGLSDDNSAQPNADFDEEMLYLSGFSDVMLDIFLKQLRRQKAGVVLKAVRTETNIDYTPVALYREISAERAAISKNQKIQHN